MIFNAISVGCGVSIYEVPVTWQKTGCPALNRERKRNRGNETLEMLGKSKSSIFAPL
jgi:hypothetical protein